jgi:hypothetical protein
MMEVFPVRRDMIERHDPKALSQMRCNATTGKPEG